MFALPRVLPSMRSSKPPEILTSCERPTRSFSRPRATTVSVADGNRDSTRSAGGAGGGPAAAAAAVAENDIRASTSVSDAPPRYPLRCWDCGKLPVRDTHRPV